MFLGLAGDQLVEHALTSEGSFLFHILLQAIPGFFTWKGSKQEHMRPLRPRIRRYIIPWMPFYWPKHSHKAGPDSKGEGKDSTH